MAATSGYELALASPATHRVKAVAPSPMSVPATSPTTAQTDSPVADSSVTDSPVAELYSRISSDAELTQSLFRQALQDPAGALERIVTLGAEFGLTVTAQEVKDHIASLEDPASKQWLLKARGGL